MLQSMEASRELGHLSYLEWQLDDPSQGTLLQSAHLALFDILIFPCPFSESYH